MIAKSKLVVALLGVALLLFNPAAVCAGTPAAHAPSHPCCPVPSSNHHGSGTSTCVCIDRQPAAPTLPSLDSGHLTPAAATHSSAALLATSSEAVIAPDRNGATDARFITFHQLLV